MTYLMRTTITLPEPLLEQAKYYAVINKTNLSQLIRQGLAATLGIGIKTKKLSLLDLAGTLDLGGKEPPKRDVLYKTYVKQKLGI
jgi:hypothetical protein